MYTALVVLLYTYLSRRLFSFGWPSGRSGWWWLAIPFLFSYLMPFLLFLRTLHSSRDLPDLLFWAVYLSMSFINSILTVVAIRDLLFLLAKGGSLVAPVWMGAWPGALESAFISRLLLSAALLLTAVGLYESHRTPRVHEVEIQVPRLPTEFDGYRVVLLSDLHIGPTIKGPFVARVVDIVNNLHPDMAVLPGDVADGAASKLDVETSPLADVKAKDGCFYTTGNHEYYWGAQAWVARLQQLGWTPLINENRIIHRGVASLVVAGIPDFSAIHMDPTHAPNEPLALQGAPEDAPVLWLSHQPTAVRDVAHLRNGVMLSGHTHGGQCFPWNLVLGFFQPYEKGLYRVGEVSLYVTPGVGYWGPPNRLGVPSEITLITLRPTPK
jgi:hypothetical protein